jgi:MFS family permease
LHESGYLDAVSSYGAVETAVPARLDRLPWARFHWMVVIGLGAVWILDGLEATIVGSVAARLTEKGSGISITAGGIGTAAAVYVAGACLGALFFGQLTDRFGRKRLFILTLAVYIMATVATAFAFAPWYLYLARFFTGAGIGGEYAAINSAIDELIPARVRGRVDLMINGSYWVGAGIGAVAALLFLDTDIFAKDFGWRLAFGCGAVLGLTILFVRRNVPESPRWLFIHGREDEAEKIIDSIEQAIADETGDRLERVDDTITIHQRKTIPFREIASVAFRKYPKRAVLCLALFLGQAFLYNAITFDLGTILSTYFSVASGAVPFFLVIFAAGNFAGPLVLGRLFDTVGRKVMVTLCYVASAASGCILALLLLGDTLTEWTFIALVGVTFFFASAGASAAYLTVSEIFPMETRALAIAFFYAIGTAAGGITGPLLFGHLIDSGSRGELATGFFIGAAVMLLGGLAEVVFGVAAEQKALEDIAEPLTAESTGDDASAAPEPDTPRQRPRPAPGLQRYRPGLGSTRAFAPRMAVSSDYDGGPDLQREVELIVNVLSERGQLDRPALAEAVRARRWGPGRLRVALGEAMAQGAVRQVGRGRFVATTPTGPRSVSP